MKIPLILKLFVAAVLVAGLGVTAFRSDAGAAGGSTTFGYSGSNQQTKVFFNEGVSTDGEVCLIPDPTDGCLVDVDFVPGAISVRLIAQTTTTATVNANTNFNVTKPGGVIQQDTEVAVTSTNVAVDGPKKEYKLDTKPELILRIDWDSDEDGFQCTDFQSDVDDDSCFEHSFNAGSFTLNERDFVPPYAGDNRPAHDEKELFSLPLCQIVGTAFPPLAFLDDLCRLKLIGNADSTLNSTQGFHANRVVRAGGSDLLSGQINWPSPSAVTDTFHVPCSAPVGTDLRYKLTQNTYSTEVNPATVGAALKLNVGGELLGIDFSFDIPIASLTVNLLNSPLGVEAPNGDFEVSLGTVAAEKRPPLVKAIDISASPQEGKPVTLTATANDNCNTADQLHYKWFFSDGGTGFGTTTVHTFAQPGTYTGSVRVTDKAGNLAARDFTVVVGVNPQTNIKFEGPISIGPNDPDPIELSAVLLDRTGDPIKGRELQFSIERQDGTVVASASNTTDVNGRARVAVRPPEAVVGEAIQYRVVVRFKGDGTYGASQFSKTFTVFDNQLPIVTPLPTDIKTAWGDPVEFSGFATDPDGSDQATVRYVWDFGDGTPVQINQKVSHAFPRPGTYTVTLTVTDKDGAFRAVTTVVTVNKRRTTIKNCGPIQVEQSASKVALCGRLLVADIDGGDADAGVKGKTLQFQIIDPRNRVVVGATDANGEVRGSLFIVLAQGCYPGRIEFAGDSLYEPFRYDFVYFTTGAGRVTQQCTLSPGSTGFALLDSDGDGCSNGQEAAAQGDPNNPYDFFDTPGSERDKAITVADIARVAQRFGSVGDAGIPLYSPPDPPPAYHPAFDRMPGGKGPNGSITAQDLAVVASQFGQTCA